MSLCTINGCFLGFWTTNRYSLERNLNSGTGHRIRHIFRMADRIGNLVLHTSDLYLHLPGAEDYDSQRSEKQQTVRELLKGSQTLNYLLIIKSALTALLARC